MFVYLVTVYCIKCRKRIVIRQDKKTDLNELEKELLELSQHVDGCRCKKLGELKWAEYKR